MHATKTNHAWTTALLSDCHSMALAHLRPHLENLFVNSDLAFLEFAEKSQTEASQIRFMEAMSVIQKNRSHIEEVFLREIGKGFSEFGCRVTHSPHIDGSEDEPLTLVSKEDTDIQVAIQNMVCSAALGCHLTLSALRKRLAVLNNGRMPEERQIPAGPQNLANAFHHALKDIVLEHETRLVIYLLFDRFVLGKTRVLYEQYNQHLVKSGILPHLRYEVKKNPVGKQPLHGNRLPETGSEAARQHAGPPDSNSGNQQSLANELFNDILELLTRNTSTGDAADSSRAATTESRQYGNSGGVNVSQAPIQRTELITEIHKLQDRRKTDVAATVSMVAEVHDPQQQAQLISSTMERLAAERDQLFKGIDRRRVPGADIRIIDLVGMMFEYMLRDKNIPSVAKAELSRLHTPYLKIAILDKSLFTDTCHPAHTLLNRLAGAAASWVFEDNLERGVFPCLRNIVQRIIEEFDENLDIFPELLEFLEANLLELESKATAIEDRSRQSEKGKERLGIARAWAAKAIEERVSGHRVPARLRSMLSDIWMEKLTFIYLREPDAKESHIWRLATQTIEAIIWATEPRNTNKEREDLYKRLPNLRKQIVNCLETLSVYGNSDNKAQLKLIRELQDAALQEVTQQHKPRPDDEATSDMPPASQAVRKDIEKSDATEASPEESADDAAAGLSSAEEAALSQLEHVAFGSWFIIHENEAALPQRVKLSWYSSISGNYMFVDGMGVRVMTLKYHELATLLATGKARIIDGEQQPFMQRAMEKIRRVLGSKKPAQA